MVPFFSLTAAVPPAIPGFVLHTGMGQPPFLFWEPGTSGGSSVQPLLSPAGPRATYVGGYSKFGKQLLPCVTEKGEEPWSIPPVNPRWKWHPLGLLWLSCDALRISFLSDLLLKAHLPPGL